MSRNVPGLSLDCPGQIRDNLACAICCFALTLVLLSTFIAALIAGGLDRLDRKRNGFRRRARLSHAANEGGEAHALRLQSALRMRLAAASWLRSSVTVRPLASSILRTL